MKIKHISLGTKEGIAELETLLNDTSLIVKKITILQGAESAHSFIFYEPTEETLAIEKAQLNSIKAIAEKVRANPTYKKLTNLRQRELFLLEHYNIPKEIADDVSEYIKIMEINRDGHLGGEEV
jgi:hypothetical protein